jgi:hypothetical protein
MSAEWRGGSLGEPLGAQILAHYLRGPCSSGAIIFYVYGKGPAGDATRRTSR